MLETVSSGLHFVLHLDQSLLSLVQEYGLWMYAILFLVIFCETGLVVTPILPGDALLFAVGTVAATGALNITVLFISLWIAAILGNTVNYAIGYRFGDYFLRGKGARFIKPTYLEETEIFYKKYGAKTIVITRFVPILRTFAPFVAGVGHMPYKIFMTYNVLGGLLWVGSLLGASYYLGNIPWVKQHFSWMILAVIVLSMLPPIIEGLRARFCSHKK